MNVHSGKKNVVTCHEKDIVVGRANVTHLGINSFEIQTKKLYISGNEPEWTGFLTKTRTNIPFT